MQITQHLTSDDLWLFLDTLPDVDAHELPPDFDTRAMVLERLGQLPGGRLIADLTPQQVQALYEIELTPADLLLAHGGDWAVWGDLDGTADTMASLLRQRPELLTPLADQQLTAYYGEYRTNGLNCLAAGADAAGWVDRAVNALTDVVAETLRKLGFEVAIS